MCKHADFNDDVQGTVIAKKNEETVVEQYFLNINGGVLFRGKKMTKELKKIILEDMKNEKFTAFRAIAGCNVIYRKKTAVGKKVLFVSDDCDYPNLIFDTKNLSFIEKEEIKLGLTIKASKNKVGIIVNSNPKTKQVTIATIDKKEIKETEHHELTLKKFRGETPLALWKYWENHPNFSWTGKYIFIENPFLGVKPEIAIELIKKVSEKKEVNPAQLRTLRLQLKQTNPIAYEIASDPEDNIIGRIMGLEKLGVISEEY